MTKTTTATDMPECEGAVAGPEPTITKTGKTSMTEPVSTSTVGGLALIKFLGGAAVVAAFAAALGFLVLWPRTLREAFVRLGCTIIASTFFGPVLVMALHSWWPSLFESARVIVAQAGADPMLGLLFVAAPVMVLAGLPAWWVIGATVRWFDRRRDKDLGEMIAEARKVLKTKGK